MTTLADVAYQNAIWTDPGGADWPLTMPAVGWFTLPEVTGLGAAPVAITTDDNAAGGVTVRHVQPRARIITWGLHIYADDHPTFQSRWRGLARAFARTRRDGPGTLTIAQPDGSRRSIRAYYQDGFDNTGTGGHLADDVVVTLLCEDPYWRDEIVPISQSYLQTADFLSPFMSLSSSSVLASTSVTNPGDVEVYPEWTIAGPASLVTATKVSTGESWTLNPNAAGIAHGDLLAGEVVTMVTAPGRLAVRGPAGQVWTAALNWPGAALWYLDPAGDTDIQYTVAGAGPGTNIAMSIDVGYETP